MKLIRQILFIVMLFGISSMIESMVTKRKHPSSYSKFSHQSQETSPQTFHVTSTKEPSNARTQSPSCLQKLYVAGYGMLYVLGIVRQRPLWQQQAS